jgi:hypothetical protein
MKISKNFSHKEGSPKPHQNDLIAALEAVESREKVHIKIAIPYETAKELSRFLKEKGILESQGIPLLIWYGLSNESEEEIERLKNEMKSEEARHLWGEYAIMKFQAYELFMENKAMVMRLPNMLYENKLLKRRLKGKGLQKFIPKSEWDNWNQLRIDSFYRKYVFASRL